MVHSSQTLPPLDTLETFAQAVRSGSFSAAAEQAGKTHGAVSRQIARLERWMGVRLFEREARGVSLTPEGMRFYARTEEALALLSDTSERWLPRHHKSVVRLSLTPSVASLWLFTRLQQLERDDIHLELSLEHRLADFGESADLAIRCGKGAWVGVRSVKLWEEASYPLASPALAKQIRMPGDAKSLLEWPILHDSNIDGWRKYLSSEGVSYTPRGQDRRFEDYNIVIDACAQGLGVALARPPLSDRRVEAGDLVRVSDRTIDYPVAFHLIRQADPLRAPVMEFAKRLLHEAGHADATAAIFTAPMRVKS